MKTAPGTRTHSRAASAKKQPARRAAAVAPAKKPDRQTAEFLKAIKALKGYF